MPSDSAALCSVTLLPLGCSLTARRDEPLRDLLFAHGVEFPCGGQGKCRGCRIKVIRGGLPATDEDRRLLAGDQIAEGWRLGCRAVAAGDLTLELAQWDAPVLADETPFAFTPREGYGVAVDLGTTTVVAQLVDLRTGKVLGVRTGLNCQARHGADLMSRIDFAQSDQANALTVMVRRQIGGMIADLLHGIQSGIDVKRVVIVGNTAMHHLFCGFSVAPLASHPFEPEHAGAVTFSSDELGWSPGTMAVSFLPCLGGFVGSDILAGILATRLDAGAGIQLLVDLGTNGEMVVAREGRMLCASTAAGPAFEGARISCGMRAGTGAISEVSPGADTFICHVIGGGNARGICGSGLVDAATVALDRGLILPSGKLNSGEPVRLAPGVSLVQNDVRELQLAKAAIAAGLRLLLRRAGAAPEDVEAVHLAGAFGNYINRTSAARIGLIDFPAEKVRPAGNTALLGAKLALFHEEVEYPELRSRIEHVPLADDEMFQEVFVSEMAFPARK